jgi:ADP-heptose:LPS heptosyltransferase
MPQRIGILRVGSLGDHLIAMPLYRRIKERHPDDSLVLICNIPAKGNLKLVGPASVLPRTLFDEWHDYPVGSDLKSIRSTYALFRRARLDKLYYLMPARTRKQRWRDRLFFWLARVPVVGLQTRATPVRRQPGNPGLVEHEVTRLARMVSIALHLRPQDLSLDLTEAELTEARGRLGGAQCAVVLCIGTKVNVNDWGRDNWSRLVSGLSGIPRIDLLVLIGAADEYDYSEALKDHWPRAALNLCGTLSPRASAAVLAGAKLYVGHDSGPMHMAASVDVPIVAIFSSRNQPGLWFPLSAKKRIHYSIIECMGCEKLTCEELQKECIRRISVEDVLASCTDALKLR